MSINRMYYGTKKIYSFLENGNQGGECNCEQEYQNGYDQGYQDGLANCTGGGGSSNPLEVLGWSDEETASVMQYVSTIPNEYERYMNYKWDEDGSAVNLFVKDNGQSDIIFAPFVYLDNQTSVSKMFFEQRNLIGVPTMDTSNVTDFSETFYSCSSLRKLPNWDFSNGRNFYSCFRECGFGELIFDAPLATNYRQMCAFANIPTIILDGTSCEDIGEFFGWNGDQMSSVSHLVVKNLKCNWDDDNGFVACPNITYSSIIEQINSLYDFRGNGDNDTTRTLKINTNTMALLSDEDKQIAVNKGWMLTE